MRKLLVVVVVLFLFAGVVYVVAGRAAGPAIRIVKPGKFVGAATPFEIEVEAPGGRVEFVRVEFQQGDTVTLVAAADSTVVPSGETRARITGEVGRAKVAAIAAGPARLVVTAGRPVLFGLRTVESRVSQDVQVRLDKPRVTVLSTHHYVNQGGAEVIVYRVEPADVDSGVRVGDVEYPGYPASGVAAEGIKIGDPSIRVAFFALGHDQGTGTPMRVFARDEAGNTADADFDRRVFPKPARRSRIELTDAFIERVVPAILAGTSEVKPEGSTLEKFLAINGELRRKNAAKIASFAGQSSPEMLWRGVPFHPFTHTAVQSSFADARTYLHQDREVDHQTHLGFDLASFAGTPIVAANRGKVLFAEELGIYGRCVIVDHGMGVQSLYAHLSSVGVQAGAMVEKGQEIGRSGMTGLAAGDHLHFTMLVAGQMVNPVEWWDPHWIEDRIVRKLREAR
jgi:murein DD-endopeptidase MepM/ murein hydrolase activator NlpD